MSPWLLGGPALAIVLGLLAFMGYRAWAAIHIPWKDYAGMKWYGPGDPAFIHSALMCAAYCLGKTAWGPDRVAQVMLRAKVYVKDTESWLDASKQKVAGQQVGRTLIVGPSLAALCHELAHLCEEELDKKVEFDHATWTTNGIFAAVDEYEARLKVQRPT